MDTKTIRLNIPQISIEKERLNELFNKYFLNKEVLISRSEQTRKAIEQIVKLNRIYTPDSFARLTGSIEAPTLILWGNIS